MIINERHLKSMVEQVNKKYKKELALKRDGYGFYLVDDANYTGAIEIISIGSRYFTRLKNREMFFFLAGVLGGKNVRCRSHF